MCVCLCVQSILKLVNHGSRLLQVEINAPLCIFRLMKQIRSKGDVIARGVERVAMVMGKDSRVRPWQGGVLLLMQKNARGHVCICASVRVLTLKLNHHVTV